MLQAGAILFLNMSGQLRNNLSIAVRQDDARGPQLGDNCCTSRGPAYSLKSRLDQGQDLAMLIKSKIAAWRDEHALKFRGMKFSDRHKFVPNFHGGKLLQEGLRSNAEGPQKSGQDRPIIATKFRPLNLDLGKSAAKLRAGQDPMALVRARKWYASPSRATGFYARMEQWWLASLISWKSVGSIPTLATDLDISPASLERGNTTNTRLERAKVLALRRGHQAKSHGSRRTGKLIRPRYMRPILSSRDVARKTRDTHLANEWYGTMRENNVPRHLVPHQVNAQLRGYPDSAQILRSGHGLMTKLSAKKSLWSLSDRREQAGTTESSPRLFGGRRADFMGAIRLN